MNGFIQEGKVRLLGVSSLEGTKLAPKSPPIADILPGYDIDTWFGILAAKDTPPAIVAKINAALTTVLSTPNIQRRFFDIGVEAPPPRPRHATRSSPRRVRGGRRSLPRRVSSLSDRGHFSRRSGTRDP